MEIKLKQKQQELREPENVAKIFQEVLAGESEIDRAKEHFWTVGLNSRNIIQFTDLVSLGTLNSSLAHPREIFRLAVSRGVNSIIIVHNHPSGNVEPSKEDVAITHRLEEAGVILGILVVDHVIIGDSNGEFHSFRQQRNKESGNESK